jgi:hypothetical protein
MRICCKIEYRRKRERDDDKTKKRTEHIHVKERKKSAINILDP